LRVDGKSVNATTERAGTVNVLVQLSGSPTAAVDVLLSISDPSEATLSASHVILDEFNTVQRITVTGVDDAEADGDVAYRLTATVQSADTGFNGILPTPLALVNLDDETALGSLIIDQVDAPLITTEGGGTAKASIRLSRQPTAPVTLNFVSSNPAEGTVSPTSVTFDPSTFDVSRTITFVGVDDAIADGDQTYLIQTTVVSSDPSFANISVPSISIVNLDDDGPATTDGGTGDSSTGDSSAGDSSTGDAGVCTNLLTLQPGSIGLAPDDTAIRIGDFNGDTYPDAVIVGRATKVVSLLRGTSTGGFLNPVTFATGVNPQGIAVGDVNGDTKLDFVTSSTTPEVNVHIGDGLGSFAAKVPYTTGAGTNDVALADLNGDTKLDIVSSNYSGNTVSVLIGNGDGTFGAKSDFAAGTGPGRIVTAKLRTASANIDAVVINSGSNTINVLLGNGNGTLSAPVSYATDMTPTDIAVADLNGDGKLDIVVTTSNGAVSPSVFSVLLGNGDGTFAAKTSVATGKYPNGVAIVDLDHDGKLDVLTACSGDSTISVNRGNGDGTFMAAQAFSNGTDTFPLALAVRPFAGRPDIVAVTGVDSATVLNACAP